MTLTERLLELKNGFNPFDPIQDTERLVLARLDWDISKFQPIRSDTGY